VNANVTNVLGIDQGKPGKGLEELPSGSSVAKNIPKTVK